MADTTATTKETIDITPESPEERLQEATNFVRRRMFWSAGVGLIPIPIFDFVALTALQVDMVRVLARDYGVPFRKEAAKSIITGLVGSVAPISLTGPVASVLKAVPIVGMPLGVLTLPILGGASTYAVGKVFIAHFEAGGTLLNFDPEAMNDYFKEKFAEGKDIIKDAKKVGK